MPTQQDAQDLVLAARFKAANLMDANRVLMIDGAVPINENEINRYKLLIRALTYLTFTIEDFTSDTFLTIYDCLSNLVGLSGSPSLDPNYQAPNTIINIINNGAEPIPYQYTEANLLNDNPGDPSSGQWYLPYKKPNDTPFTTEVPIELTVNGVQSGGINIDYTFYPPRIFGFSGNYAQAIELTVI